MVGSSSFLQVTRTTIKAWMSLNLGQMPSPTTELAVIERLKSMYNLVTTTPPLLLIGSSSFLQVTRTAIKSWIVLKFYKIGPGTVVLAALECLEKVP